MRCLHLEVYSNAHALAGKPTRVTCRPTLADGLSVPLVGANAFAVASPLVDQVVSVRYRICPCQ